MPTLVASTGCQRQLVDINIIADQKFQVPPRLSQVRGMACHQVFQVKCCTFKELDHPRLERNKHFLRSQFLQIIWNGFSQTKTWQLVETFESPNICFLQSTEPTCLFWLELFCNLKFEFKFKQLLSTINRAAVIIVI